ncbi:MAG: hypothetical protein ABSB95_09895, partial [Dissulfurispiraceae bacterium]
MNVRAVILLIISGFIFLVVPPCPDDLSMDIKNCLHHISNQPQVVQELASLSLSTADSNGVPPAIVLAILIAESCKRPAVVRYLEIALLKVLCWGSYKCPADGRSESGASGTDYGQSGARLSRAEIVSIQTR